MGGGEIYASDNAELNPLAAAGEPPTFVCLSLTDLRT